MKRQLIVVLTMLGIAVSAPLLFAQTGPEAQKTPPVEAPAVQTAPAAQPASISASEAKPVEQASPQATPAAPTSPPLETKPAGPAAAVPQTAPALAIQPAAPATAAPAPSEMKPAEQQTPAQPAVPAVSAPAPATVPAASPVAREAAPSGKVNHKDYAAMELRECAACHKGEGVAPNHEANWVREHRLVAGKPEKNCADCHDQQFCLDCHTGGGIKADLSVENWKMNYAPHSHRTDFEEIHPIKALDNPQTCTRCHDSRFCSDCHAKFRGEDLMIQSHRRAWSDLKTSTLGPAHSTFTTAQCQTCHPKGLLPQHVWSQEHAREARRNLQSCQTCHSDGAVCQTCHSARRGLMINPHPRNWDAVKDRYRSKSGGRSCIVCHDVF